MLASAVITLFLDFLWVFLYDPSEETINKMQWLFGLLFLVLMINLGD